MSPSDRERRTLATRFAVLAATILAMLALIVIAPVAAQQRVVGQLVLATPVFLGIHLAGRSTRLIAGAIAVMLLATALGVLAVLRDENELLAGDALLHALVLGLVIAWVVREVLRDEIVSLDTILGAICAYLLLGFLFANLYRTIHLLDPAALASASGRALDPRVDRSSIFYFSYVTLTTVAYGDILPVSPAARFAAMIEGMIGQLYPAIFLARLVSLNAAQRR